MGYKEKAKYNYKRFTIYDKKGGPCLYLLIYYLPYTLFDYTWNEWTKKIRVFGLGFELMKLPF